MTECNTDVMRFSRQGRRRVEADFGGGRLVSDAGLLTLREVDRATGLTASLAACLPISGLVSKVFASMASCSICGRLAQR